MRFRIGQISVTTHERLLENHDSCVLGHTSCDSTERIRGSGEEEGGDRSSKRNVREETERTSRWHFIPGPTVPALLSKTYLCTFVSNFAFALTQLLREFLLLQGNSALGIMWSLLYRGI